MFSSSKMPAVCTLVLACYCVHLGATDSDAFGGRKDIKGTPTGWFHLEKIGGRDILVSPDGHGFLPLGVDPIGSIKDNGSNESDLFSERDTLVTGSFSQRTYSSSTRIGASQRPVAPSTNSIDRSPTLPRLPLPRLQRISVNQQATIPTISPMCLIRKSKPSLIQDDGTPYSTLIDAHRRGYETAKENVRKQVSIG
jgi:hypothetical protein